MFTDFSYHRVDSKEELYKFLPGGKILAGGTDLLVDMRSGGSTNKRIVDIKPVADYNRLDYSDSDGLTIGACVTLNDLADNRYVREKYPILAKAAHAIGSHQLRNRATIVGNICNASPGCDMAPALMALDATVEIASANGRRQVNICEFFKGVKKTVVKANEVVEKIIVSSAYAGATGDMLKLKRIKGHDLALVGAALIRSGESLRLAVGSCAPTPLLVGWFSVNEPLESILQETEKIVSPIDDVRASAEYRMFMLKTYIKRLYENCLE